MLMSVVARISLTLRSCAPGGSTRRCCVGCQTLTSAWRYVLASLFSSGADVWKILEVVARKMRLAPDVQVQEYAEQTEGWTGANLRAALYSAHVTAVHDAIPQDAQEEDGEEDGVRVCVVGGKGQ